MIVISLEMSDEPYFYRKTVKNFCFFIEKNNYAMMWYYIILSIFAPVFNE